MSPFFLLLLPVAAGSGWWAAKKNQIRSTHKTKNKIARDYFIGLNFLLNDQHDKAVEVFIKLLEVNSDTVETHLALGNLFRRKGQVDRAIRIHENLIARPNLTKPSRIQSMLALAKDYLSAGVFDQSEKLFKEVLALDHQNIEAFSHLLDIYQTEKSWLSAIEVAQKLAASSGKDMNTTIAHNLCELAQISFDQGEIGAARNLLRKALAIDRQCVRASMMQAEIEASKKCFSASIRALKQVKNQNSDYFAETIPSLVKYATEINKEEEIMEYLKNILPECPRVSIALTLSDFLLHEYSQNIAAEFLINYLIKYPSIRGLARLIELLIIDADEKVKVQLNILYSILETILKNKPHYLCHNCGFSGKTLLWFCPSCRKWNTIKPVLGLEGE